jgi:hypothetical protein
MTRLRKQRRDAASFPREGPLKPMQTAAINTTTATTTTSTTTMKKQRNA